MTAPTSLQFIILTALAGKSMHGYALVEEASEALGRRAGVATVYASLERLMELGWILPERDEVVDGRLRRYYKISPAGLQSLSDEAKEMARRARVAQQKLQRLRTLGASA